MKKIDVTPEQAYYWLAPKLPAEERQALEVIYAEACARKDDENKLISLIRQAQAHMLRTPEAVAVSVKLSQYLMAAQASPQKLDYGSRLMQSARELGFIFSCPPGQLPPRDNPKAAG